MEKLDIILKALDDKIAENVVSIDLKGKSSIAEYFVIATGSAVNHNQAICDEIEFQLKKNNQKQKYHNYRICAVLLKNLLIKNRSPD